MERPHREMLQLAERWFRAEKSARGRACRCTSAAGQIVGAGVEVRCTDDRGGPGCGFAVWWPAAALEAGVRAVA